MTLETSRRLFSHDVFYATVCWQLPLFFFLFLISLSAPWNSCWLFKISELSFYLRMFQLWFLFFIFVLGPLLNFILFFQFYPWIHNCDLLFFLKFSPYCFDFSFIFWILYEFDFSFQLPPSIQNSRLSYQLFFISNLIFILLIFIFHFEFFCLIDFIFNSISQHLTC